ncbi:MAG: hypothetical protein ABF291_18270, partial [Desulfobacterales bacterium]
PTRIRASHRMGALSSSGTTGEDWDKSRIRTVSTFGFSIRTVLSQLGRSRGRPRSQDLRKSRRIRR